MKARKSIAPAWEPPVELPQLTVWDIAKRAGVSIATVSRTLNRQGGVSEKTREKVLKTLRDLEYENSQRSLERIGQFPTTTTHPDLIAFTSAAMDADEYPLIIGGITEASHARNSRPVICPLAHRHNCGMPLRERLMVGTTKGGLIIGSTDTDSELLEMYQDGFPTVVIYPLKPVNELIPVVTAAHWQNARVATEHLITLGHRRIATVVTRAVSPVSHDRLSGFQSAMLSAGLAVHPDWIFSAEGDGQDEGYQAALALLDLAEPPTAIVAFNDDVASGVLQAAYERNLSVPRDLSLVGCGDLSFAQRVIPALTTVNLPFEEMGRVGVDMLFRLISGQKPDMTRVELTGRLIVRASTAAPA